MIPSGRGNADVTMDRSAYKFIQSVVEYRLEGSGLKLLLMAALSPLVLQAGFFRELTFKPVKL